MDAVVVAAGVDCVDVRPALHRRPTLADEGAVPVAARVRQGACVLGLVQVECEVELGVWDVEQVLIYCMDLDRPHHIEDVVLSGVRRCVEVA